jgi:hypothetical protein
MPDQRSQDAERPDPVEQDHDLDTAVLDFMLLGDGWPWSVQEIARELGSQVQAEDAIGRLTRTGLVHRLGEFVFPTRTARQAAELQLGTV